MTDIGTKKSSWIELAGMLPGGGMKRNHFVQIGDTAAIASWRKEFSNRNVYASICRFDQPRRSGHYVCDFFVDMDAEDLGTARDETLKLCNLLMDRLVITPGSLDLHFSGAKGFHIILPLKVFGEPCCTEVLQVWRALAGRLAHEGVAHMDQGVYQNSRVLRLSNSINSKTGLYKIPIEYKELHDLGVDYVLDLAREPRKEESMAIPEESPKAVSWFDEAVQWLRSRRVKGNYRTERPYPFQIGWRIPPCIRNLEATTLPDGIRHPAYLALAMFYSWIGAHPFEAEARIRQIDSRHPIADTSYISRIAVYGRTHPCFPGCKNPVLERYCNREACFRGNKIHEVLCGGNPSG